MFNSADTWATSRLGASYVPLGDLGMAAAEADIVIECTGHAQMLLEAGQYEVRNRITCLTGVSSAGTEFTVDPGATQQWTQAHQNSRARGRRRPATARPPGPDRCPAAPPPGRGSPAVLAEPIAVIRTRIRVVTASRP